MTPRQIVEEETARALNPLGLRSFRISKGVEQVIGPRKFAVLVEARRRIAARLKAEHRMSSTEIGLIIRKDHSTVLALLGCISRRKAEVAA